MVERRSTRQHLRGGSRARLPPSADARPTPSLMQTVGLVILIAVALGFDFTNGFHDAANAVAVSITTRALSPMTALTMAAGLNVVGALVSTEGRGDGRRGHHRDADRDARSRGRVRRADRGDRLEPHHLAVRPPVVVDPRPHRRPGRCRASRRGDDGAVGGASSTRSSSRCSCLRSSGSASATCVMVAILWLFRRGRPAKVNHGFRRAQIGSTAAMAFSHGTQDAQKTMGVITLALVTTGQPLGLRRAALGDPRRRRRDGTRHARRRVARHPHARQPHHGARSAEGVRVADRGVVGAAGLRVRLQGPGVVDAHHDDLHHGRRRDPTTLGGALERRPAGRARVGPHDSRRAADLRVRDVLRRQRRSSAELVGSGLLDEDGLDDVGHVLDRVDGALERLDGVLPLDHLERLVLAR